MSGTGIPTSQTRGSNLCNMFYNVKSSATKTWLDMND